MTRPDRSRVPLLAAGLVAGLQALALVAMALADLADLQAGREGLGVGIAIVLGLLASGLVLAAWAVARGRHGGRGPVVVAQLIALGLTWNLVQPDPAGRDTRPWGVALGLSAAIVLVALLLPSSRAALADRPTDTAV